MSPQTEMGRDRVQERALVAAAARGDGTAFEQLMRPHYPPVVALCAGRVRDHELAQDLAQEAFLRAWLGLGNLAPPYHFGPWVRRIAFNLATSHLRSAARQRAHLAADVTDQLPDVAEECRRTQRLEGEALGQALASIDDDGRALVEWHYADGLTKRQIAGRLGTHPATVGRRLERALGAMRRHLESPVGRPLVIAVPIGLLRSWMEGLRHFWNGAIVMGTAKNLAVGGCVLALLGAGVVLRMQKQEATPPTAVESSAAQVATVAGGGRVMAHPLGTESTFSLGVRDAVTLDPGPNKYGIRSITVSRAGDGVDVGIAYGTSSTQRFRGSITAGDFLMLGMTSHVEDGTVDREGTEEFPAALQLYGIWESNGEASTFRVTTVTNDAFGRELLHLRDLAQSNSVSNEELAARASAAMKQYAMFPAKEAYKRAMGSDSFF